MRSPAKPSNSQNKLNPSESVNGILQLETKYIELDTKAVFVLSVYYPWLPSVTVPKPHFSLHNADSNLV